MKNLFLLVILALVLTQTAFSQKYIIDKNPVWIKEIAIPEGSSVSKYNISEGFYLTLADYQVNLDDNMIYSHQVIKVLSYSGITKASQLTISFDSSYQQVKIHHLYIWRKGEKLDRTSTLSFEKMNNEFQLAAGIYTGQITLYDNLNDIRKDDLIDFAYSIVGKNPIFENEKYLFIPLEADNPVDLYNILIMYSKDKDYLYRCVGCDSTISYSDSVDARYHKIELSAKNLKALNIEEGLPSWVIPFKYFTLSSLKSWKDVNLWAQRVFALKKEPDLKSALGEIFTGNESQDDKINKIIDYVQDDIRYMGLESGIGSIKPFAPDQVIKQRFGDCKDKSLLLVSLLKKIGVREAYPVLVNTNMRHELDQFLPSNEVFNHCIVKFVYRDTTYWVDPTYTQQGGDFKDLVTMDCGKVLVIGDSADTLVRMTPDYKNTKTEIVDEFFIKSFNEPASLKIKSVRYGAESDARRVFLEQYKLEDVAKSTLDELRQLYPEAEMAADVIVQDDIQKNILTAYYEYKIDKIWMDGDNLSDKKLAGYWLFRFEPQTMYQYMKTIACADRKFDVGLAYPVNLTYQVIFHFPKELLINDDYKQSDNEAYFYEEKTEQLSPTSFQIVYNFKTKSDYIKAGNFEKLCEQTNDIVKKMPKAVYFKK